MYIRFFLKVNNINVNKRLKLLQKKSMFKLVCKNMSRDFYFCVEFNHLRS